MDLLSRLFRKKSLKLEIHKEIRTAVIAGIIGALFGFMGTFLIEWHNTQKEAQQRRRQIALNISERASATNSVLVRMRDTAELVLKAMEYAEYRSGISNISEEFKALHMEFQDKAWHWPLYIIEEAQNYELIDPEALNRLRIASQTYIEILKKQIKLAWTLHAYCVALSYEKERVQQVKTRINKLQTEQLEAVKQMQAPFEGIGDSP